MSEERIAPQVEVAERRGQPRHECGEIAQCFAVITGQDFSARVRNLSRTGVGILVDAPIPVEAPIILRVPRLDECPPRDLHATVVHCLPYSTGEWFAGCKLDRSLTDEELRQLLNHWS
jgi:hypothetical protein